MVAKIISGKNIRGMLHYNENKVSESKAQLLLASGFAADVTQMSLRQKLQRFQHLTMLTLTTLSTTSNYIDITELQVIFISLEDLAA